MTAGGHKCGHCQSSEAHGVRPVSACSLWLATTPMQHPAIFSCLIELVTYVSLLLVASYADICSQQAIFGSGKRIAGFEMRLLDQSLRSPGQPRSAHQR